LRAKSSFSRGDFFTSIKENQEILNRFPKKYGDHALYAMGLIYAYPEYPDANYETSMTFFKKLIREYPESVFKNQAKIWISILNQTAENEKEIDWLENSLKAEKKQIENLQNQIKRLKEIDLGIEEKKREALPEIEQ
jgi:outer membrane protein assembly factor BamD (BamD/ComL family)